MDKPMSQRSAGSGATSVLSVTHFHLIMDIEESLAELESILARQPVSPYAAKQSTETDLGKLRSALSACLVPRYLPNLHSPSSSKVSTPRVSFSPDIHYSDPTTTTDTTHSDDDDDDIVSLRRVLASLPPPPTHPPPPILLRNQMSYDPLREWRMAGSYRYTRDGGLFIPSRRRSAWQKVKRKCSLKCRGSYE